MRVALDDDGRLAVGRALPGRGAWLCADSPGCVEVAETRRAVGPALRANVPEGALRAVLAGPAGGPARPGR